MDVEDESRRYAGTAGNALGNGRDKSQCHPK